MGDLEDEASKKVKIFLALLLMVCVIISYCVFVLDLKEHINRARRLSQNSQQAADDIKQFQRSFGSRFNTYKVEDGPNLDVDSEGIRVSRILTTKPMEMQENGSGPSRSGSSYNKKSSRVLESHGEEIQRKENELKSIREERAKEFLDTSGSEDSGTFNDY